MRARFLSKMSRNNRRKLTFSDDTTSSSPGPKVKVQIGFNGSSRSTTLKGSDKLACRAIVMKQCGTALNHIMNIKDMRQQMVKTLEKTIRREAKDICRMKNCVLRLDNFNNFSWSGAFNQIRTRCPIITELLTCIRGNKKLHVPRLVSSLGVLLFTKNQNMSALQAINSVMMFTGHVRTRVYTSLNRAGMCKSYKSTIKTIDKLCEKFDEPVKVWAKNVEMMKTDSESATKASSKVLDEHSYSALDIGEPTMIPDNNLSPPCIRIVKSDESHCATTRTMPSTPLTPETEIDTTPQDDYGSPLQDFD